MRSSSRRTIVGDSDIPTIGVFVVKAASRVLRSVFSGKPKRTWILYEDLTKGHNNNHAAVEPCCHPQCDSTIPNIDCGSHAV